MEEEERIYPDKGFESNEDDVSLNIFHEESMLDKLRSCSTIPKNISEFQDFVRKLTKGTISDPIIQEVWGQIHSPELNIEDRILIRNAMTEVQCVASKTNIKSGKRKTKYSSFCELKNSKEEKDNKAYCSDDYIRIYKEIFPNESLKNNEQNFLLSTGGNAVKFSELFEQNTKQNREECHSLNVIQNGEECLSTYKNSKPDKLFYKANKSCDRISESNKSKINTNNNKNNSKKTNISPPDTSTSSIWKENVSLTPSIANSTTHLKDIGIETNINGNVMSCEKEEMEKQEEKEDESSSDCEVIQVVSLNKSKSNIRDDYSDSETNKTDNEIESSDSDSSIEILETSISNKVQENRKIVCPVHGNENVFKTQNSSEPPINNENCRSIDISEQENSDSVVADKKCKNQKGKTKRNVKYNTLRTEVKCLKSLLINLLLSLKNNSNTECMEVVNNEAQVSSADMNVKLPVNTEKMRIQNSISEEKSNLTTENITLKTPAMRKQNMSGFNVMEKDEKNEGRKKMKRQETKNDSEQLQGSSHHKESGYRKRKKFPWREVITGTLKSKPGRQMHVEKLQRLVIAKYYMDRGNVSRNTKAKFFRYLLSTPGVAVDGEIATFSNKQNIQMLKETKEFVMKTTKTTKEYTIS